MAMTSEEKKAYAKEYYQKYTKKGLLKGRKKGTKKKTSSRSKSKKAKQESLIGVTTSGLNPNGIIQANLQKEQLKKEMNEKIAKAKTPEEKNKIRVEYSQKAQAAMQALKNDPQYAKQKITSSKEKSGGSSKSGSGSSGSKSSGSSSKESSSKSTTAKTPKVDKAKIKTLENNLDVMQKLLQTASPERKKEITALLGTLRSVLVALKG